MPKLTFNHQPSFFCFFPSFFIFYFLFFIFYFLFTPSSAFAATNKAYLRAAYNSRENRFFLVWADGRNSPDGVDCYRSAGCNPDIYGAFLDNNLNLGQEIPLATQPVDQSYPEVAYNSRRNEYLVVYHQKDVDFNIYAIRTNKDGQVLSTIPICQEADDQWEPAVTYDSINDRYLALWMSIERDSNLGKDIQVQLLSGEGTKIGQSHFVSQDEGSQRALGTQERPMAVFIPEEQKYLIVWENERRGGNGTVLDKDGNITISPKNFFYVQNSGRIVYPQIGYSSYSRQAMVAWQEGISGDVRKVKAQRLTTTGQKIGEPIVLEDNTSPIDDQFQNPRPGIACDPENGSCLVGWFNWLEHAGKLQFIDKNGQKVGSPLGGLSSRPTIIFNSKERYFLVIKSDNPAQSKKVPALASLPKPTLIPSPTSIPLTPSATPTLPVPTATPSQQLTSTPQPTSPPPSLAKLNFKIGFSGATNAQSFLVKLQVKSKNFLKQILLKSNEIYQNLPLIGLPLNENYNFFIDSFPFLSAMKSLTIKEGINPADAGVLDFGTLKTGDLNCDNQINGLDWSLMKGNFGESGEE